MKIKTNLNVNTIIDAIKKLIKYKNATKLLKIQNKNIKYQKLFRILIKTI